MALMTWGGVRGGISIALALSLPDSANTDILTLTYVVVLISILLQGSTFLSAVNFFFPTKKNT